jgi:hypothetical protein
MYSSMHYFLSVNRLHRSQSYSFQKNSCFAERQCFVRKFVDDIAAFVTGLKHMRLLPMTIIPQSAWK